MIFDYHKNANEIRECFTYLVYPWGYDGSVCKYGKHAGKRRKQLIARANRAYRFYWGDT